MSPLRMLLVLIAVCASSAAVAPPALATSKVASSKVLALRGGAKQVSKGNMFDDIIDTIQDAPLWAKALAVWLYLNKDGDSSKGKKKK